MTTIATIALPLADSWQITVGGGWIIVMLIGMAFCFAMFAFMSLMHGGRGWPTCGLRLAARHDTVSHSHRHASGEAGRGAELD